MVCLQEHFSRSTQRNMRHKEDRKRANKTDSLVKVKDAIREKKLPKVWVKTKLEENYIKYRIARRHSKRVVKTAKESSWKAYSEELNELCKHSPREFYKSVKAMRLRNEIHNPTTMMHGKVGNPLYDENSIKHIWQEHFKGLLNPASPSISSP